MTPTPDTTIAAQIEALAAFRDPTDAMLDAAERVDFDNEDERAMACNLWHAMWDMALPAIVTALRQAEAAPISMLQQSADKHATVCGDLADKTPIAGEPDPLWWQRQSALREASVILAHLARQHGAREDAAPSADAAMMEELRGLRGRAEALLGLRWATAAGEWGVPDWVETDEPRRFAEAFFAALDLASRQPAGVRPEFVAWRSASFADGDIIEVRERDGHMHPMKVGSPQFVNALRDLGERMPVRPATAEQRKGWEPLPEVSDAPKLAVVPLYDKAMAIDIVGSLRRAADSIDAETEDEPRTVNVIAAQLREDGSVELYGWGRTDRFNAIGVLMCAIANQT